MIYLSRNTTLDMNISLTEEQSHQCQRSAIRETHFTVSMIYFCLGVAFNIFTLAMIKRYHNEAEYHKDTILTMHLFVNNLLASIFVTFSMAVNAKFLQPYNHGNYPYIIFCKVQLYLEYSIFGAEYLILIVIGISRYLMINQFSLYQKIFIPPWNYRMLLIGCWAVCPVVFLYTLFLPWDNMTYSLYTSTCYYKGKGQDGFFFSTAIFLFTIPIMMFTYIAICVKLFKVNHNLKSHRRKSMDIDKKVSEPREKWLVITIIVLFFKIFVTYLPNTMMVFIDPGDNNQHTDMTTHLTFLYLRLSNTFSNAISYCLLNSIVRSTLLKLWPFCHGKVHSNSTSSASNPPENISLPDIEEEADIVEKQTVVADITQNTHAKMELTVSGKLPTIEENMRMSFSSNSIYIISTNSLNEDDCDEMFCESPRAPTLTPHFSDDSQEILPSVQSTS